MRPSLASGSQQGRYADTGASDTAALPAVPAAPGVRQPPVPLDTEQVRIGFGLPRGYTPGTMDDVLNWTEETLALRHAAMRAKMTEPDYEFFEDVLESYSERVTTAARDHQLYDRDEDDGDDLSWWADQVVDLAEKLLLAIVHHGADRYTAITSSDRDYGEGRLPAWAYHIDRIDGEWRIVGQTARYSRRTTPYAGRDHRDHPAASVRYFNADRLRSEVADFVGSIPIG